MSHDIYAYKFDKNADSDSHDVANNKSYLVTKSWDLQMCLCASTFTHVDCEKKNIANYSNEFFSVGSY